MSQSTPGRGSAFPAFVGYLGFVIYGSLVPFAYRGPTLAEGLRQFAAIPWLDLGIVSRADWIANAVLYAPLAFLACNWAVGLRSLSQLRHLAILLVLAFCVFVAVAVEFTQVFFAPRTVSLNDLLAETLGSLGGTALFAWGRWRIARLLDQLSQGGRKSGAALGIAYFLVYFALALFPYDFVLSRQELAWKLASGQYGWLFADDCASLTCLVRQTGEALAIVPLGLFLSWAVPSLRYRHLFILGVGLGLFLELAQLLLASGYSQGMSVVGRGLGLVAGAALGQRLRLWGAERVAWMIRGILPFAVPSYLWLAAKISGWASPPWSSLEQALARLGETRFLPFYYHYYSTEMEAMNSLLAIAGLYAPVGVAARAWRTTRGPGHGPSAMATALGAALLALLMEAGKLWAPPPRHPDPTNLLIAAVSAALVYVLADWAARNLLGARPQSSPHPAADAPADEAPRPASARAVDWPKPHPLGAAMALGSALGIAAGLAWYPVGKPWLILGLAAYGLLLWRRPSWLFFTLPALLPILDLRPYTGDLLLNEFDLAVLVSLALGYWRAFRNPPSPWPNRTFAIAIGLLWASWALGNARGLWPGATPTDGIPASSHSPLEAWQVGKGLLWALLLVPLIRRVPKAHAAAIQGRALAGLVAGLALETLAVLWERYVYVGLGDFENVFRVTGTFADMRTGGAYIEGFIALAFPALAALTLTTRHWTLKLGGIALAALSGYAMLVTFSRGGYGGLVAGLLPVALAAFRQRPAAFPYRRLALAGLVAAMAVAAVPVLSGGFAKARLAGSSHDFAIRLSHWRGALDLMDDGPVAALTGMGFGQYPLLYILRSTSGAQPGTYSLVREDGNPHIRLGAGESTYLEQIVGVEPGARYELSARIRRSKGDASLAASLCAKALLYSFECMEPSPAAPVDATAWHRVDMTFATGNLGNGHRTVKLSLHNPSDGEPLDIDDLSLKAPDGRELLANGGFDDGVKRWLFATDQDLAWHIHQMSVEMYLAQGWLGLAALAALLGGAFQALWPALKAGSPQAAAWGGGLVGFLAVGSLGSTMDAARLSMLFYMCAFCAGLLTPPESVPAPLGRTSGRP